jgi:hypothetical protein
MLQWRQWLSNLAFYFAALVNFGEYFVVLMQELQ